MEVRFPHGSINQMRVAVTRRMLAVSLYKSSSFGSKPAVRFDGIDDVLNLISVRPLGILRLCGNQAS